jgi:hypothetical protein
MRVSGLFPTWTEEARGITGTPRTRTCLFGFTLNKFQGSQYLAENIIGCPVCHWSPFTCISVGRHFIIYFTGSIGGARAVLRLFDISSGIKPRSLTASVLYQSPYLPLVSVFHSSSTMCKHEVYEFLSDH